MPHDLVIRKFVNRVSIFYTLEIDTVIPITTSGYRPPSSFTHTHFRRVSRKQHKAPNSLIYNRE